MTIEEAIKILNTVLFLGKCAAPKEEIEECLRMAIEALEQEPYEKFESTKDHIYKLAGDYKCWDNRLTHDEALELCHMLEQEPCEDCISRERAKQFLYERIDRLNDDELYDIFSKIIDDMYNELPPVTPTQKRIPEAEQNAKDLAERICEQIAEEADYGNVDRDWYYKKVAQYMRAKSEV